MTVPASDPSPAPAPAPVHALVRLFCPRHGGVQWLVVRDLPTPPPSPDVLTAAVAERARCGDVPLCADVVAVFAAPRMLHWRELTPWPEASPAPPTPPVAPAPPAAPAASAGTTTATATVAVQAQRPIPPRFAASWLPPGRAEATWFQPFASRVGRDWVVGLRFAYDAVVVAELKELLRQLKPRVVDRGRYVYHAGGWLSLYRCWFVEPMAWPDVHQLLARHGYTVSGPGPHPHP